MFSIGIEANIDLDIEYLQHATDHNLIWMQFHDTILFHQRCLIIRDILQPVHYFKIPANVILMLFHLPSCISDQGNWKSISNSRNSDNSHIIHLIPAITHSSTSEWWSSWLKISLQMKQHSHNTDHNNYGLLLVFIIVRPQLNGMKRPTNQPTAIHFVTEVIHCSWSRRKDCFC
jgi:hypothetical protein